MVSDLELCVGELERKVVEAIGNSDRCLLTDGGCYFGSVIINPKHRREVVDYLIAFQQRYGRVDSLELTPLPPRERSKIQHILIEPTEKQAMKLAKDADEARAESKGPLMYVTGITVVAGKGYLT